MTDKTKAGHINIKIRNKVAYISFFHPSHNSLPSNLLSQLSTAIYNQEKNDNITIIVLQSEGDRTFCAGASFDELVSIENAEVGKKFFLGFANVINAIRKSQKLIIGRVQGKSVGGGVGLAAATDYCLATKYASIKLSELSIGIGPFVIAPAVERKIGLAAYSNMTINAKSWKTAQWAHNKGLYAEVFESTKELDEYLEEFAHNLSNMNPEALITLKKTLWEGTENWDQLLDERAELSGKLVLSDYAKEALKKFIK